MNVLVTGAFQLNSGERKQLEAAGAIVVRSNAQSTYLVHHMLDKLNGGKY